MQITEITIHAGRKFNHPYENYSNLAPAISMKATLNEGEDPEQATRELQKKAEKLVESHKRNLLDSIETIQVLKRTTNEVRHLEEQLQRTQERLDEIRKEHDPGNLLSHQENDGYEDIFDKNQEDPESDFCEDDLFLDDEE